MSAILTMLVLNSVFAFCLSLNCVSMSSVAIFAVRCCCNGHFWLLYARRFRAGFRSTAAYVTLSERRGSRMNLDSFREKMLLVACSEVVFGVWGPRNTEKHVGGVISGRIFQQDEEGLTLGGDFLIRWLKVIYLLCTRARWARIKLGMSIFVVTFE